MTIQLLVLIITITGTLGSSNIRYINGELDSTIALRCEIAQLPFNAVVTWVHRPKIPTASGVGWLPLYANARRLTQNNRGFIVDYSGYNTQTQTHVSILTINQLNVTDAGIYMCKSSQYPSVANIFNVSVIPSMKILPNTGLIELNRFQRSINLSCTVHELPANTIDPSKLKWYHNKHAIHQHKTAHLMNKHPHYNQATLILYINNLSHNDSGLFKCIYNNGIISKDVQLFFTSSVLGYSKSLSGQLTFSGNLFALVLMPFLMTR